MYTTNTYLEDIYAYQWRRQGRKGVGARDDASRAPISKFSSFICYINTNYQI